jgi:hypothetical protein
MSLSSPVTTLSEAAGAHVNKLPRLRQRQTPFSQAGLISLGEWVRFVDDQDSAVAGFLGRAHHQWQ